jgi:DNA modification methylase
VRTDHDVDAIAESIKVNGFRDPIELWATEDGKPLPEPHTIVAGEGRYLAARRLVLQDVPCIEFDFDSLASAKRYAIANNRLTDKSAFDDAALLAQLEELPTLEGTGFTLEDLEELGDDSPVELAGDPDDVPDVQEDAITKPGDVWLCGDHRVMCGDSTDADNVEDLLCTIDHSPGIMVTDPPYGVEYDPNWRNEAADKGLIAHAARRVGKVANDDRVDWSEAWGLVRCDVAYVWHASWYIADTQTGLLGAGYELRNLLIWGKSRFSISRGHYHWQHEPCWYAVRTGKTAQWAGDRSQTTLWSIELDKNVDGGHSTQKPVECMARPLRNHDFPEVYDPFLGSGTTLVAAETLGRTCFGMDIEPRYVDVSVRRWQNATGKVATLESTGEPFPTDLV